MALSKETDRGAMIKFYCWVFLFVLAGAGTIGGAQAVDPPDRKAMQAADKYVADYYRLFKAGEEEEALKCIDKAISIFPAPSSYRFRAEVNLSLDHIKEAVADARKAVELEPKQPENIRMLARVLAVAGKTAEAVKEFDIACALEPKNGTFRFERARLLEHNHEYAKAAADYTVTIACVEPQNRARYYEARATCYMQMKEYKKAVADYTDALAKSVGQSKLLRGRALAYKAMGDNAKAQKDLKDATEMDESFQPPTTLGAGR